MGDLNEWFIYGRPARWLYRHFGHPRGSATFPARFPLFSLDRIFVSPPGLLLSVEVVRSPLAQVASDHLPLLARLRLGAAC
jgi:endonuclease/exonuclease/phosphatase family metal-dependent hydrolase